jgi:hypothetical protein
MGFPAHNIARDRAVSARPTQKFHLCCKRRLGALDRKSVQRALLLAVEI